MIGSDVYSISDIYTDNVSGLSDLSSYRIRSGIRRLYCSMTMEELSFNYRPKPLKYASRRKQINIRHATEIFGLDSL